MAATTTNPVSFKQTAFIASLCEQRNLELPDLSTMTTKTASAWIDWALTQPKHTTTATLGELESGMYRNPDTGDIYKVYKAVHGSGKMCAKVLHLTTTVAEGDHSVEFEYVGLASKHVKSADWKMTLDEAKAFGAIYGVCCVCAATLTDEASIAAGIGPICAKKWF